MAKHNIAALPSRFLKRNSCKVLIVTESRSNSCTVQHISIAPTPPLDEFIQQFWYSCGFQARGSVRVVPSGTIELVFNLAEDDLSFHDTDQFRKCQKFSGAIVSGVHARPLFVDTREHVMGAHFKPGGAFRFLEIPANELTNTHVDVEMLWGRAAQDLREQLSDGTDPAQRIRVLEKALVARLENTVEPHRSIGAALQILARNPSESRIRDVAAHLGLSQRHFISIFATHVGLTPKVFSRVERFQRAAVLTRNSSEPDWADVAVACGYSDQSHLIRDFRIFSGLSPTEFLRQRKARRLTDAPIAV